jgi:hypothetical protein
MKYPATSLVLLMVIGIFFAGCMQSSGTLPVPPAAPISTVPTPEPATPVPTEAATTAPRQVVTIVHLVSQVRDIKDSELLFTLQVPAEWSVSTHRLVNPDNSEGLMYQTDLVRDRFFIHTYTISRSGDQNYRNQFRQWSPPPTENTVIINDITFDRFESVTDGTTNVSYIARKTSANERGYASVLYFTANTSNRFEKEDYEKIVSSFRYFEGTSASTMPGEEIERIAQPEEEPGSVRSAVGSGSSGSSGGSSPGGCSRCRG